jgi:uncharacterized protein YhbP (UPF0306 family)
MTVQLLSQRSSEQRIRKSLLRILRNNVLCSIATVSANQRAHINTAYFCYSDELELYFLSNPDSLHCRNLLSNSSTAVTIFSSAQKWGGPDRGIQLFGTGAPALGAQMVQAEELYRKRFKAYAQWKAGLGTEDVGRTYQFYRFIVRKIKILDEVEFGDSVFIIATVKRVRRS